MTHPNEKAAGMLDTSATAEESKRTAILPDYQPSDKEFATAGAQAAQLGYSLHTVRRIGTPRVTYLLKSWSDTRTLDHWLGVIGTLASMGGRP